MNWKICEQTTTYYNNNIREREREGEREGGGEREREKTQASKGARYHV